MSCLKDTASKTQKIIIINVYFSVFEYSFNKVCLGNILKLIDCMKFNFLGPLPEAFSASSCILLVTRLTRIDGSKSLIQFEVLRD